MIEMVLITSAKSGNIGHVEKSLFNSLTNLRQKLFIYIDL